MPHINMYVAVALALVEISLMMIFVSVRRLCSMAMLLYHKYVCSKCLLLPVNNGTKHMLPQFISTKYCIVTGGI